MNSSIKKIYRVFEKMKHKSISVSGRKIDDKTYDKRYPETIVSLFKEANKKFGIKDISQLNENMFRSLISERIDDYHQNDNTKQSWNINKILAATKSFNLGIQETNIFKNDKKFSLGNTDEVRNELKEKNIRRYSKTSSTLRAKPDECEAVIDKIQNMGYKTKTREIAYHIAKICYLTGSRVTAALNLKAGNINVEGETITFVRDKGGLTHLNWVDKETAEYLSELKKGLKDHQNLFLYQRKDDTKLSVEEMRKKIERIVNKAAEEFKTVDKVRIRDEKGNFKTVEVEKKFTVHSFRKGFCVNRTYDYLQKFSSQKVMDDYVSRRIAEDPQLRAKLRGLEERINKNRNTPRKINRQEYAIFFTSVDVAHFRNDVLTQYYTTYKEVEDYFNNKK